VVADSNGERRNGIFSDACRAGCALFSRTSRYSIMTDITFYDCAFSPLARKVRMVLEYKELSFEALDSLHSANRKALAAVNPRREVPVLVDGEMVVVNSSHIVAYLEDAYPHIRVFPADAAGRARVRHWERIADTVVDPILVDISLWSWARRDDAPPPGLLDAARRNLDAVYRDLEQALQTHGPFVCGIFSIADIALFPHLYAARRLEVGIPAERFPRLAEWLKRMTELKLVQDDLERVRAWLAAAAGDVHYEKEKIFWRGDRIEWLLAAGFHQWFFNEIESGRVLWPGQHE
jgi:glutathione S-transferase